MLPLLFPHFAGAGTGLTVSKGGSVKVTGTEMSQVFVAVTITVYVAGPRFVMTAVV
jgi:hypothetical protein